MTFRRIVAALLFTAIAIAVGLAAAPQLHEWLHKVDERGSHQCAATMMSAGNIEHSNCEPPPICHEQRPATNNLFRQTLNHSVAVLTFSLLEHAPPAQS